MGSFNEVCVLSHLSITPETPIRMLFLTQNPYLNCDEHEWRKGIRHNCQWFVRTPPLQGTYDDYGKIKITNNLSSLICDVFSKDVLERPMGFNSFHSPAVFKGRDIEHYLDAAWEGRLLVVNNKRDIPESYPDWRKVTQLLQDKGIEGNFKVQDVIPGVVIVSPCDNNELSLITSIFDEYDCKIFENDNKQYLIVTIQGGFEDPSLLADRHTIDLALNQHPEKSFLRRSPDNLPVMTVMIREDVWEAFCDIKFDKNHTVDVLREKLQNSYNIVASKKNHEFLNDFYFHDVMFDIVAQTTPSTHLRFAALNGFEHKDELINACAELARVELMMSFLNKPWHLPSSGGQDPYWSLQTKLIARVQSIAKKQNLLYNYHNHHEEYY